MHEHHIKDMVRELKPVCSDPVKAESILKRYWSDKMALVWTVDDVYLAANERAIAVSKWEAIEILQMLLKHHNAQCGIKWEDLTTHIEDQMPGRKLTKQEIKRFVDISIPIVDR